MVSEGANQGIDSVNSSVSYTLPPNVENLTLTGTLNLRATGNALSNVLTGNAGNNVLDANAPAFGAQGADTLRGGAGDDTYYTRDDDLVEEFLGQGNDTVVVDAGLYTLPANVEDLVAAFSAFHVLDDAPLHRQCPRQPHHQHERLCRHPGRRRRSRHDDRWGY
ncbi:MAG: hypothetical protein HC793_03820 [Aquincola sp.]|nr:hypothetical protein [Aquincola sp.]